MLSFAEGKRFGDYQNEGDEKEKDGHGERDNALSQRQERIAIFWRKKSEDNCQWNPNADKFEPCFINFISHFVPESAYQKNWNKKYRIYKKIM